MNPPGESESSLESHTAGASQSSMDEALDSVTLTGIRFCPKKSLGAGTSPVTHAFRSISAQSHQQFLPSLLSQTLTDVWTLSSRSAHLSEHILHRLLSLPANFPRRSCVSSYFRSEYIGVWYFCSFLAFDCCIFTYVSVINTPTRFSECCSGGFHTAQTRARTAEFHPGFDQIHTHTQASPPTKMTVKSGLRHMCERLSVRNPTCSAQHSGNIAMNISV